MGIVMWRDKVETSRVVDGQVPRAVREVGADGGCEDRRGNFGAKLHGGEEITRTNQRHTSRHNARSSLHISHHFPKSIKSIHQIPKMPFTGAPQRTYSPTTITQFMIHGTTLICFLRLLRKWLLLERLQRLTIGSSLFHPVIFEQSVYSSFRETVLRDLGQSNQSYTHSRSSERKERRFARHLVGIVFTQCSKLIDSKASRTLGIHVATTSRPPQWRHFPSSKPEAIIPQMNNRKKITQQR